MGDVDLVEKAERLGRKRSQIFFALAMVFFAGQSIYFGARPRRLGIPRQELVPG